MIRLPYYHDSVIILGKCRRRYCIHIVDLDPGSLAAGGWLEDTSLIEKYTISDESYNKRDGRLSESPHELVREIGMDLCAFLLPNERKCNLERKMK